MTLDDRFSNVLKVILASKGIRAANISKRDNPGRLPKAPNHWLGCRAKPGRTRGRSIMERDRSDLFHFVGGLAGTIKWRAFFPVFWALAHQNPPKPTKPHQTTPGPTKTHRFSKKGLAVGFGGD